MANKPLNINDNARKLAAQGPGQSHVNVSFESDSVSVAIGEALDVAGVSHVFAFGGGAVTCHDTPSGTPVALEDITGAVVAVTTARLIDVRGVRFIEFAASSVVVYTG